MQTLNKESLYHSIMAGAYQVLKHKQALNEINVFPVADGDTGTNLASLMQTILEQAKLTDSLDSTLDAIGDAALMGARGNSGIIFAQYLNGFLMQIKNDDITVNDFAVGVCKAVPYAYSAIANPVEGTMITVMKEWAEYIDSAYETSKDFTELLEKSLEVAKVSLADTPNKLKILKDAKVVDAGALGFIHFIEGFLSYVKTGKQIQYESYDDVIENIALDHSHDQEEHYRYCTEALIEHGDLSSDALKELLKDFGDSLVVAENKRKMRIHIHTDTPEEVFLTLRNNTTIIDQKVDDMKLQFDVVHNRKYKIALVTDSIADLPKEIVDENQVFMYPIGLTIENSTYFDKVTITTDTFYEMMDSLEEYPKSSQPNQRSLENYFSFISSYYDEIIAITVSEKMSGTYSVFTKVAEKFKDKKTKVHVINSKQNSGAEGLVVLKAINLIKAGKDYESIIKELEETVKKTKILVSVDTLKYMVRSGRVKKVVGVVGKILNLKPVISIDEHGEGIIYDKALSVKGNTKKILAHIEQVHKESGIESYSIVHAKDMDRAKMFEEKIKAITGLDATYITQISSVVAMAAGIGAVGVSYTKK